MQETLTINNFSDVVKAFPTMVRMAELAGVEANTVAQWKSRNRIPPRYWRKIIAGMESVGIVGFTLEAMLEIEESVAKQQDKKFKRPRKKKRRSKIK